MFYPLQVHCSICSCMPHLLNREIVSIVLNLMLIHIHGPLDELMTEIFLMIQAGVVLLLLIVNCCLFLYVSGGTRDIGSALTRMCMRHRSIEAKLKQFSM